MQTINSDHVWEVERIILTRKSLRSPYFEWLHRLLFLSNWIFVPWVSSEKSTGGYFIIWEPPVSALWCDFTSNSGWISLDQSDELTQKPPQRLSSQLSKNDLNSHLTSSPSHMNLTLGAWEAGSSQVYLLASRLLSNVTCRPVGKVRSRMRSGTHGSALWFRILPIDGCACFHTDRK